MPAADRRAALALALIAAAVSASAHGVHEHAGRSLVQPDQVETTVELPEDDAAMLASDLVVRDGSGARLAARLGSVQAMAPDVRGLHRVVRCQVIHAIAEPTRWLSFQLVETIPERAVVRRMSLIVTSPGFDVRQVLLTSGGNVETLPLERAAAEASSRPGACPPTTAERHPERLHSVAVLVTPLEATLRLDVILPLGLLESFTGPARIGEDFLEVADHARLGELAGALVMTRVGLQSGERDVPLPPPRISFLDLDDDALASPVPRRIGAWTARVRVSFSLPRDPVQPMALRWDLFNSRILTARAIIADGHPCPRELELSTVAPLLRW